MHARPGTLDASSSIMMIYASKSPFWKLAILVGVAINALEGCGADRDTAPSGSAPKAEGTRASCGCDVRVKDESASLSCGQSTCVGGSLMECGPGAEVTERGPCTAKPDAGALDSGATPSAAPTSVSCADDLSPSTCAVPGQYCIVGKSTRPTGSVITDGQCVAMPSGCSSCNCAVANAQGAFTRVGGGCKDARISCNNFAGAITVTCNK